METLDNIKEEVSTTLHCKFARWDRIGKLDNKKISVNHSRAKKKRRIKGEMEKIDKIKKKINIMLQSEFPDWNRINKLSDDAIFIEDNLDSGYTKTDHTDNELAENDINMANEGFVFEVGNLDWLLESDNVSRENKEKIRKIKKAQGV